VETNVGCYVGYSRVSDHVEKFCVSDRLFTLRGGGPGSRNSCTKSIRHYRKQTSRYQL